MSPLAAVSLRVMYVPEPSAGGITATLRLTSSEIYDPGVRARSERAREGGDGSACGLSTGNGRPVQLVLRTVQSSF